MRIKLRERIAMSVFTAMWVGLMVLLAGVLVGGEDEHVQQATFLGMSSAGLGSWVTSYWLPARLQAAEAPTSGEPQPSRKDVKVKVTDRYCTADAAPHASESVRFVYADNQVEDWSRERGGAWHR